VATLDGAAGCAGASIPRSNSALRTRTSHRAPAIRLWWNALLREGYGERRGGDPSMACKRSGVQIPSAPPGTTHRQDPCSGPSVSKVSAAGSSSEPGLLRTAPPDRPWRSWPWSWGQACAGRRRRRLGRRGAGSSSERDRDRDCDGREPQPPVLPGLRRVAVRLPDDPTHRARDRAAASWRPQPHRGLLPGRLCLAGQPQQSLHRVGRDAPGAYRRQAARMLSCAAQQVTTPGQESRSALPEPQIT
jgi:hypothetical protein